MITKMIRVHGTASEVTFEFEGSIRVKASGEFLAKADRLSGFFVSTASLRYEDGEFLDSSEQKELIRRYEEYMSQPHDQKNWTLEFE